MKTKSFAMNINRWRCAQTQCKSWPVVSCAGKPFVAIPIHEKKLLFWLCLQPLLQCCKGIQYKVVPRSSCLSSDASLTYLWCFSSAKIFWIATCSHDSWKGSDVKSSRETVDTKGISVASSSSYFSGFTMSPCAASVRQNLCVHWSPLQSLQLFGAQTLVLFFL